MVLIAYRLAVACGAVRVAAGFPGTGLVWLRAVLVLITFGFTLARGAVRVATGFSQAGLVGLWTILVLIAYRLAVACGAARIAAELSGPGLVRLRAIMVFVANWLAVARGTARVAAGHGDHGRLGRRFAWAAFGGPPTDSVWILESGLDVLPCSAEEAACLTQWLLGWFGGTGLNLFERLLLILDCLPGLSQEAEQTVIRQLDGQVERLVQVHLQAKHGGLIRHLACQGLAFHLPNTYLGQGHVQLSLFSRIGCRFEACLLHGQLGRVQRGIGQAISCQSGSTSG
jgi:hypothetical protein